MPTYRFATQTRQTSLVEFGLAFGPVCEHLKAWGHTVTSINGAVGGIFTFTTVEAIPQRQLAHIDLQEVI